MKISPVRARIHGALAVVALLLLLVVGSPAALVAWGHLDATTVLRPAGWLAPDDGSIFLTESVAHSTLDSHRERYL